MSTNAEPPTLLFIVGPPASGKMTVGREIAQLTGFRLLHNHVSIEAALLFFEYGHPSFVRISEGFRKSVLTEVAASDLPGLVFTYWWAFNEPAESDTVAAYAEPFASRGGRVLYLELECDLAERLRRNGTALRLAEKPSKRDPGSHQRFLDREEHIEGNSPEEFRGRDDWLRIDNTQRTPLEVAELAIRHFGLPVSE
ncbi:MAG: hypothetical protein ACLGH3_05860 [Actinomycetota bacterium]